MITIIKVRVPKVYIDDCLDVKYLVVTLYTNLNELKSGKRIKDGSGEGNLLMRKEDTRGVHLWLILWKATRSIEAHAVENIRSLELCYSDFAVLEALLNKGELPVNTIGKKVLLTSGSITTAVDRLEQRGLVERKHISEDRRARIVRLTKEGRKLIEAAFADHEAAMEHAVSTLSASERATLARLLKKVGKGAAEMLARPSDENQATTSKSKPYRASTSRARNINNAEGHR